MSKLTEIKDFVKFWYTLGRFIVPDFGTREFNSFAGNSISLAYEICQNNHKRIGLKVVSSNECSVASADMENNTINLSENLFNQDFYHMAFGETTTSEVTAMATATINACVIHEALHLEVTASERILNFKEIMALDDRCDGLVKQFGQSNVWNMINIVEDIYIESKTPSNLMRWIKICHDILFSDGDFELLDSEIEKIEDISQLIRVVCLWKHMGMRDHKLFNKLNSKTINHLNRAGKTGEISIPLRTRVSIAYDILESYEILTAVVQETSDGDEGESGDNSSTSESLGDQLKDALKKISSLPAKDKKAIEKEIKEAVELIEDEIEDDRSFRSEDGCQVKLQEVVEVDVMNTRKRPASDSWVHMNNDIDFSFVKDLVASRNINHVPGRARHSGPVMVKQRLTRIATDGKIFAKNDSLKMKDLHKEIIILIDFSGSTTGNVISKELSAAKEMSRALRAANVAHSVYGHSSQDFGIDKPYLYHIFSHNMLENNTNFEERFEEARKLILRENYDGMILKKMADKFTGKSGQRYLFVLSDGSPAGDHYHGTTADLHTKSEVANLRKNNIHVISLSVVGHVVLANNLIYGEDFNLNCSTDLRNQFKKLIGNLFSL